MPRWVKDEAGPVAQARFAMARRPALLPRPRVQAPSAFPEGSSRWIARMRRTAALAVILSLAALSLAALSGPPPAPSPRLRAPRAPRGGGGGLGGRQRGAGRALGGRGGGDRRPGLRDRRLQRRHRDPDLRPRQGFLAQGRGLPLPGASRH